ncbi:hypothetical protein SARC_11620 [Sphaeroforma arctica JP610]|uniref:Inositol polyphosphate-related phosphatase domain-containing protein n=1 Tax=Sphaeroforma arctica JP610 TaxID=667725 RepID=A0A0L0FGG5_9EUKA|nr:hypothetical protein SARC_11620 [Sphaeroforma arctica JP610]KNC75860.1 hypothetical protein SARC_11620 [Sphaeroforma arctica JP610]|eukprot:XP_014149762.1 hypothetical protein SARC_11620 [Sphaeroforma arctica JP610]
MVYVKAHVAEHVRDVADTWVGVGLMNMMGNKGGVAVRFRLHDTSFLFINSHLAAHQDMVERRNQDFDQIQRRLVLPPLAPSVPHETASLDKTTIHDYDRVVWMGDLNYRIDLSNKKTRTLIDGSDWSDLYCSDQLMKERAKGRVFNGFKEEEITFPPTYKFDFGTDMYDTSEKQRIPAWTDRVLYKPEGISCSNYTSHPTIMISDHKPVSAVLSVDVNIVDEAKLETVYQNVLRDNDRLKNIALPDATVDTNMVEFGDLRYMEAIKHQVKLTNVGYDTVRWCFVARSKDSADEQSRKSQKFHDSWLVVSPLRGSLAPGESCEFTIEANVGPNTAHRHNMTPHKNETSVQ